MYIFYIFANIHTKPYQKRRRPSIIHHPRGMITQEGTFNGDPITLLSSRPPGLLSCSATARAWPGRVAPGMAWPGFSDNLASMVMGDLLWFCSLAACHPLHLAYLLFFSPYLLAALSFLGPLLVSTCFLLLALLTVSPYLTGEAPPPPPDGVPSPPGPCGNTLRLVLDMLDPWADGEPGVPPVGALCGIASELQACVDSVEEMYRERGEAMVGSANPGRIPRDDREEEEEEEEEEKRIVVEATIPPGNELFGWELEAISKLYRALTYEVEEFPVKLAALRGIKEGNDLFPPPATGFHGGPWEEDLSPKEAPTPCPELESRDRKLPTSDDCEDVDIPLGDASKPAIKGRDCQRSARSAVSAAEADGLVGDDNSSPAPLKGATTNRSRVGVPRSDSDGSKQQLLPLRRSSSSSSGSRAAGAGLARMASAGEWRGSGSSRSLSSSGSMRKEKEWRRTLACKLYEERVVADSGEEGMDLLWETYELGSGRGGNSSDKGKEEDKAKPAKRGGGKHVVEEEDDGAGGGEEEEVEEETVGRLCCLQALRFSTAKMSFGMGRSGLFKISKAMKGTGVFRRALRGSRKGGE